MNHRNLLIGTGGAVLAFASLAITASATFARGAPDLARMLWPVSSAAAGRKAEMLTATGEAGRMAEAGALAERALLREPLNVSAARTLGIVAAQQGRADDAERMLALAQWLSRRDVPTQMALIESQVARGNVIGALVHYDRAMRTSVSARAILLPVLVPAADDPQIARHLAERLRGRPWWWQDFFDRYSQVAANPASLTAIAAALDFRPAVPADAERLGIVINRLVGLGAVDRARQLYAHARPGRESAAALIHDGGFESETSFSPFEWAYVSSDERAGVRESRDGASGKVALSLTGTVAGVVARQLLVLAPGRYALFARVGETGMDAAARPFVTVACAGAGSGSTQTLKAAGLPAADRPVAWRMAFDVPKSCPVQWLSISIGANLDAASTTPWIDDVRLDRIP